MASPAYDAVHKALDQYDSTVRHAMGRVAKQLQPHSALLNGRISAQIAASVPRISVKRQLQPLIEKLAKNVLPNDAFRGFSLPPSVLQNLYGADFDRVASKHFDFQRGFQNID